MSKKLLLVLLCVILVSCYKKEQPILVGSVSNFKTPQINDDDVVARPPVSDEPTIATLGHAIDNEDNLKMYEAMKKNPTYKSSTWTSTGGATYTIIPTSNTLSYQHHAKCRRYRSIVVSDDKKIHAYGIACKQEDDTWISVKNR